MSDRRRRSLLFVALAGVAAWSIWLAVNDDASEAETELAEPVARARPARAAPPPASVTAKPQDAATRLALARANLFPQQTWHVPPPPPPPLPPPPPPQAPALPFRYMGSWEDAGQTTWYLARGTVAVSVRTGQVLDGVWRLETASAGLLNFTYLPLNQTRSLRTGD